MAVKVCKLRVAQQRIERGRARVFQEIEVGPQAAETRTFGIAIEFLLLFILARIVLRRRIHLRAVALVVPPCTAEITRNHVRARVHVTDHALRSRNLTRELVFDRMTRFALRNRRIGSL